jgi:capsular exopolysaccharide synthesis family protein
MVPFLILPIAAYVFSERQDERYESSASVLYRDIDAIAVGVNEDESPPVLASGDASREGAANVALLTSVNTERQVERRLGGERAVAEEVEISAEPESNVLRIDTTDTSPGRAARTANAYALEFVSLRRRAEQRKLGTEIAFLTQELNRLGQFTISPGANRIRRQLRRLDFLRSQQASGARVISRAERASTPSSPRPVRNALLGGIVGLFLAGVTALLFERLDPRLRTPRDVESALDRPVLGFIRKSRALAGAPSGKGPPSPDADDFLAIRNYLKYAHSHEDVRSLLVTSSAAGDGKTTVAWNLAWAAAGPERRALLIEADLRHPRLASRLGVRSPATLAQVLDGDATLAEAIQDVAVESSSNGQVPARVVSVVFAGPVSDRPRDPEAWERLGMAVKAVEQEFDLVVIDTPPMPSVSDAVPLAAAVDGVLVVSRMGNTPRAGLVRLREQLEAIDAPMIGAVINGVNRELAFDYGYDHYGYG